MSGLKHKMSMSSSRTDYRGTTISDVPDGMSDGIAETEGN